MKKNTTLDQLRKLAIRIQIDPNQSVGHAANLDSVIHVLTQIKKSYNSFLEVELAKKLHKYKDNKAIIDMLKKDLSLIAVDLNFGSFEIALAPNIIDLNAYLFSDESMTIKKDAFHLYKDLLQGDFRDYEYMKTIGLQYAEQERAAIYRPIFNLFQSNYKVNIKNEKGKVVRTIVKPSKEKERFYIPRSTPESVETPKNKTILAYVDIEGEDMKLSSRSIKKVHYIKELEHDTYPFTPIEIVFEDTVIEFNVKLVCQVTFEDNSYIINNELLDITTWGDTREEAEEAFRFSIYSIYINFYSEKDINLSKEAILLKETLFRITKKYSG